MTGAPLRVDSGSMHFGSKAGHRRIFGQSSSEQSPSDCARRIDGVRRRFVAYCG